MLQNRGCELCLLRIERKHFSHGCRFAEEERNYLANLNFKAKLTLTGNNGDENFSCSWAVEFAEEDGLPCSQNQAAFFNDY